MNFSRFYHFKKESMADPKASHIWPKSDQQELTILDGRSKNVPSHPGLGELCRGLFRILILQALSVNRIFPLRLLTPA